MGIREKVLKTCLPYLPDKPNCIEIGSAIGKNEGCSTHTIGSHALKHGGKMASVEFEEGIIRKSRVLISSKIAELKEFVTYYQGHSLEQLPLALSDLGTVDFAFIDGGGHPEVNLQEFELISACLSERGIIVIDDAEPVKLTKNYPLPRPFGKATLIYPALMLAKQCSAGKPYKSRNNGGEANPKTLEILHELGDFMETRDYVLHGQQHKMIVVAETNTLIQIQKDLGIIRKQR